MSGALHDSLVRLGAVFRKEVVQTTRDPRVLLILLAAPLLQLVLLGFAVNLNVNHVPLVVVDQDHTARSRDLGERVLAGDTFDDAGRTDRPSEAVGALERGETSAVLVLPRGLGDDLGRGRPATVQALVDGTDSNRAIIAANALAAFTVREALALAQQSLAARAGLAPPNPLRVEPRVFYNPTLESATYFVPGIAATLLLIVTVVVTAMGLAREKETGTLEQVLVTPIAPSLLILGKILPYAVIGLLDLLIVLCAAMWVFHVPMRGSPVLLFAGGALYLQTTLGVGLLASTLARQQQQAFMAATFFIMPAIILSGFLSPIANMHPIVQAISAFDPVRHFVEILRAVMLKGASWSDLRPQFAALAGTGACVLLAAVTAMRRRLA